MLMAEFATACRYELPIKVIINNNASLGQIMWEQLVLGYPSSASGSDERLDFAPWAAGLWGQGHPGRQERRARGARSPRPSPSRARPWSTSRSTPTSRRCPARCSTSRPKAS